MTFSRRNVAKRDHYVCQYCGAQPGAESITIDHVLPRSQGGTSTWTNCVAACSRCNARKGDRTPEQAGMRLRRRPARPEWKPFYAAHGARVESWARFLAHEPALRRPWPEPCAGRRANRGRPIRTGVCSWESSEPPKLADRVQILAPLLICRYHCPWSVTESHATLRRSRTRFDSWRGHCCSRAPRECVGRTAVFEAARPGSIPGRGTLGYSMSSECDGFAYDSAKVVDQVQFLARTLYFLTLEPDGQATGCNPVQVGSTPTGVFDPAIARCDRPSRAASSGFPRHGRA